MDKRTEILDAAEQRARRGGYFGFSFREIAEDVGIKSASVHYHFPTKEDLAQALGERYLERAKEELGDPHALSGPAALQKIASLFISSNESDNLMCLCGIFGAEISSLPAALSPKVAKYFDHLTNWLAEALGGDDAKPRALTVVAALEGAIIIARSRKDPAVLRTVADYVTKEFAT